MNQDSSCTISTDPALLDTAFVHNFLASSYWAKDIPLAVVERSIANSLCFGAYGEDGRQVGFARVITDYATFGYVADVFVAPEHRGQGISKRLIAAIRSHPDIQGLRRLLLVTKDAQGLYAQFGFEVVSNPEQFMTVHRPNIYTSSPVGPPTGNAAP